MSLLLQREHSLFHQMMTAIERHWLVHQLDATLVLNMRQHILPPILFQLQYKLLRELPINDVEKLKQYPPAIWRCGADGKMERIAMFVVWKEYKKINCDMFALTFGHHDIPPMDQWMSKKWQRLNYKQYCMSFRRSSDMALMSLTFNKTILTVVDLLVSPLAKYITLAANDCGYSGTAKKKKKVTTGK
jgi:hypothetical protein